MKIYFYIIIFGALINNFLFGMELSADGPIEYDPTSKHLIANDNVHLISERISLRADQIEMNADQSKAIANGNVIFINKKMFMTSDSIDYDIQKQCITTKDSKIYLSPIIINATQLYIEKYYQQIDNGTLYFGQPDKFSPNIHAKKFEIKKLKKVHAKSVVFKIGEVPFFYLPKYTFPIAQHPFWLKNDYGVQENLGLFTRNDFYFRANPTTKVGGLLDVYTKRGFLLGPAIKYEKKDDINHSLFSETKFGFIHDNGSKSLRNQGISSDFIEKDRFLLKSKNKFHFNDHFDAISRFSLWSDPEVTRDFRPTWYNNEQIPESFIETTYYKDNYIISAFSRLNINNFYQTVSQVPELRINMLTKKLWNSNIYNRAFMHYTHLKGYDNEHTKHELDKFDIYYGLSMPIDHSDWLNFTPIMSVRTTEYLNCTGYHDFSRIVTQLGFDANMLFSGKSDTTNSTWGINGLKHIVQPILQYRYIPEVKRNKSDYPIIERDIFETNMPIINLADIRNIDDIKPQNMIRVGVRNTLQTSTNNYIARDLIKLDFFQDILLKRNFNEDINKKESTLSNSYLFSEINFSNWLSFQLYSKIYTQTLTLEETTTSTNIHDGNVWQLELLTHTIQNDTCQCGLKFSTQLNSRINIYIMTQFDARIKKFTEQCFSLKSKLGHSWYIEYYITFRHKASRESHCQFNIKLDLIEF